MALWSWLGQAATVAQLVGVDISGLISMIMQAALTARQNKEECEQLARRVFMIAELLPHLQDPEVMRRPELRRPLVGLDETLREAHELVMSCQEKSAAYWLMMAGWPGWQAERFREVQSRIDSYLLVFPFIVHIDITHRLDRIYKVLLSNDRPLQFPSAVSHSHDLEVADDVAQEMQLHGEDGEKFTLAELLAATNNYAPDRLIGIGSSGTVYMGRLPGGREVAIKWMAHKNEFMAERTILSSIRHNHIVRLFGCCVERYKHEINRSVLLWRKNVADVVVVEPERLLVFEYMKNGSLHDHLHGTSPSSSPVRTSWRMRIEILLGVSRAIEYLHTTAPRPVVHRDIKPSNILLDASWAPRLSDFGSSCAWNEAVCDGTLVGTPGYVDPQHMNTLSPRAASDAYSFGVTSDVYSFGVVMLEVLTGRKPVFRRKKVEQQHQAIFSWEEEKDGIPTSLAAAAVPVIEAGEMGKVMDRRPAPEPTPRQLQAVDMVAHTAARCVQLRSENRPAMSEVVTNLQAALELVRCDQ